MFKKKYYAIFSFLLPVTVSISPINAATLAAKVMVPSLVEPGISGPFAIEGAEANSAHSASSEMPIPLDDVDIVPVVKTDVPLPASVYLFGGGLLGLLLLTRNRRKKRSFKAAL